jgi:tripeptide aminopeptidase
MNDLELLKEVLSIPTVTYNEKLMVDFIIKFLKNNNIDFYIDSHLNVYATKQTTTELTSDFYFPCVISHTDTVHDIDTINVIEDEFLNAQGEVKLGLYALNNDNHKTGIGGDDKCGVFACLKLLQEMPNLKAAFFVSEETGCKGSAFADEEFFNNVGYAIQFDAPFNWMISEYCSGQQLFDRDSEFFEICNSVLVENMDQNLMQYMKNPYTDVYSLRRKFNFSCINFSIGYYNYHRIDEYVIVDDVFNGIKIGKNIIDKLGNKLYYKKAEISNRFF